MKKLLVVLLALTVLGIFAFADDAAAPAAPALVLSGNIETGFQINAGNGGGTTPKLWESNDPAPGSIWLDGTFAGTAAGGKFEIYTKSYDSISSDALFGWWKPIAMLTLSAGEGYGAAYTTPIEGWGNGGTGVALTAKPIAGLVIQVEYPFGKAAPYADLNNLKATQIQASYALTGVATLGANLDLGAKKYFAGLNVSAIKDLTALVDFEYDDSGASAVTQLQEKVGYAVAGFSPAILIEETFGDTSSYVINPSVGYALGSVTPSIAFTYNTAGDGTWSVNPAVDFTVEKNAIHGYIDYNSDTSYDLGLRYIVSF